MASRRNANASSPVMLSECEPGLPGERESKHPPGCFLFDADGGSSLQRVSAGKNIWSPEVTEVTRTATLECLEVAWQGIHPRDASTHPPSLRSVGFRSA